MYVHVYVHVGSLNVSIEAVPFNIAPEPFTQPLDLISFFDVGHCGLCKVLGIHEPVYPVLVTIFLFFHYNFLFS